MPRIDWIDARHAQRVSLVQHPGKREQHDQENRKVHRRSDPILQPPIELHPMRSSGGADCTCWAAEHVSLAARKLRPELIRAEASFQASV